MKSYLSGGLYKIPLRTGLDLGRKISIKILPALNAKIRFPIIWNKVLTKQATFSPPRDRSDLTRSCPSISSSLLKFALSSFVSLNSITVTYVSLVMYRISSILGRSLFTLKWMKCMLHALLRFPEKESGW